MLTTLQMCIKVEKQFLKKVKNKFQIHFRPELLMEREIESKYFIFGHLTGYVIFGELITPLSYQRQKKNAKLQRDKEEAPEVRL